MPRTTIYLIIASCACVCAAFTVGYLFWQVDVTGGELVSTLQRAQDDAAKDNAYREARTLLNMTEDDRLILNTYVLSGEEDTVTLLSLLDTIASDTGVTLVTDRLEVQVTDEAQFDTLRVTLSITGTDERVMRTLRLLETLPYQASMSSLKFDRSRNPATGSVETDAGVILEIGMMES